MMGGDQDASSKGIFGITSNTENEYFLLVIDPHYYGKPVSDFKMLHCESWVKWTPISEFMNSSFYNLCMPQFEHT